LELRVPCGRLTSQQGKPLQEPQLLICCQRVAEHGECCRRAALCLDIRVEELRNKLTHGRHPGEWVALCLCVPLLRWQQW